MARYNSSSATTTITGTATISTPFSGAFTGLTGTAPYTVTLPAPTLFPGTSQTFYNSTAGTVTLSTPSGLFGGLGASGTGTLAMPTNTVTTVTSDGVNYIVLSEDGSALVATTGSFTGDVGMNGATVSITSGVLTLNPSTSGTINNVAIGGTTRAAGSFVALNANGQVNFTSNTASSSTTTGTLVVTGGIGASGTIYAGGFNGNLTGTIQTAAQTNITSLGTLTNLRATGLVGINQANPVAKLHIGAETEVNITNQSLFVQGSKTGYAGFNGLPLGQLFIYDDTASTADSGGAIGFGANTGSSQRTWIASINSQRDSATNDATNYGGSLVFYTRPAQSTPLERLRITSTGSVGIGTTNPTTVFSVKATDGTTGGIRLEHSAGNGPMVNISQQGSDGYIDMYTGENPTTLRNRLAAYGVSYFNPGGGTTGKVAISTTSAFSALQVGGNTFSGIHGMYSNTRVGISNHGNLTGLMLASTYNDPTWPEYGLVFVHGANTSNYNVWSLSPDGPARGSDLNFIYGNTTDNIHVVTPKVRLQGSTGRLKVGTNNSFAVNEPAIITSGPVSNRDGRYITGWWVGATSGGNSWLHIKTNLWGGGASRGNDMYIMGGFHIMGYYYSNPGNCDQWIMFHNWSGSTQNAYNRTNAGNWTPDNAAYVGSDGYVYLRVVSGTYVAYHIDLHQFPIYPLRDITVLSTTYSNSTTI